MYNEIDYERLRKDLINYFGTAASNGYPQAIVELTEVETSSREKLLNIAINNGINIDNYINNDYLHKKR